ncbi:MAG: PAS domain-containing protein [Ramlibacter sp.]
MSDVVEAPSFLQHGGVMGALMRQTDWSRSVLGPAAQWPQSLKTAVSLLLRARQPMFIGWGKDFISIYNDGYVPICGAKHPRALGRPMSEVWAEIWTELLPLNEAVMRGESLWFENKPFDLGSRAEHGKSYFSFSYTPLLDDAGEVAGIFCSAIETTSTIRLESARNEQILRQRRMFEQAPGFICTLHGPDHVFDFVNAAYERLFDRTGFVGKSVREVFPELVGQGYFEQLDHVYRTGERYVAATVPARLRQPDPSPQHDQERTLLLSFVYAPIYDEDGHITGIFCEGQDVTESHAAQQALREKEEQLRLATEAAEVGLWDLDMNRGEMFWPPRVKAMFGISPDKPVTMADFYGNLHPEDRERVTSAFAAAADPRRRALYDVEYRTVGAEDGVVRWVAAKGRALFGPDGQCVRLIGTAIDITSRKAVEEALRESDRHKDDFIATLAHELRNPLAPLSNGLHVLRVQGGAPIPSSRVLDMMQRQLGNLVRLVDDLLEISRISRGTLELRAAPLQLADAVAAACEASDPLMRERRHDFVADAVDRSLWVHGDLVRLTQLLSNLLNNAAHYTPVGGKVRVQVEAAGPAAVIRVIDTGQGFRDEDRERLFEMFARGDGSGGLGIGLALGRRLAQMHGGTLTAESPGPGRGAVFTATLPLCAAPGASEGPPSPEQLRTPAALRVLVVDDNADAGDSLELLLRELGAQVTVARSGTEALATFERVEPAVVLLDVGMPQMDGYEVARRLRTRFSSHRFSIVGLTGWGQERDRELGRKAGFDHHLVKPAGMDALQAVLRAAAS